MTIGWVQKVLIVLIFSSPTISWANDIYVNQVGDDIDLTIVQDGQNNQIEGLNGSGSAVLSGNAKIVDLKQTGNTNELRIWTSGNDQTINADVTGNSNISKIDNHGNDNFINLDIDGDNNITHTEIGNGGDVDNTINLTVDGDTNNVYAFVGTSPIPT